MHLLRLIIRTAALLVLLVLTGCGRQSLLSDVAASGALLTPNGDGEMDELRISYQIGAAAKVTATIEGADGQRYPLRESVQRQPSRTPYTLSFNGTVPGADPGVRQQVLPDGTYSWVLEVVADSDGASTTQRGQFEVRNAAATPPAIEDLSVTPVFSPNEDAVDDVAYFSYRLPISATTTIELTNASGETIPFISDLSEDAAVHSHIWDGKRTDGALVASGTYTYTVTARDEIGNIVDRQGQIVVENPGRSEAQVTFTHIAPVDVALGSVITMTARIKNTGDVPIRTQGPGSGYEYTTNASFSSVDDQKYAEKGGGFWRVGLDWGGGRAYPFRWALSAKPPEQWAEPGLYDYLLPGEEVEVTGRVRIEQREDRMQFFVGLIHEGVGYPVNNAGRTLVCVGIPNVESQCPHNDP